MSCPAIGRALVGVCALKLVKVILAAWLVFGLVGCNSSDQSSSASATNNPQDLPVGNGVATLSWEAPTTTTSGAALTDLSGYHIYYGIDQNNLTESVSLSGVGIQTYVIDNLGSGTWYFAIKAVTSAGTESALSDIVSKTIS
jgi:uncharacterized lipoprotein NlpE involved in copper resistance